MPFSVIKITRTLLAREDHFLELHNVQHGEKDPVDGGTPTLMKNNAIRERSITNRITLQMFYQDEYESCWE